MENKGVDYTRKSIRTQERRKIDEFKIEQLKELETFFKVNDNIDFFINQTRERSD